MADQLVPDEILTHCFCELTVPTNSERSRIINCGLTNLVEMRRRHVPHPPTLIRHGLTNLFEKLVFHLWWGQLLRNSNQVFDSEKSHGVLIIALESTIDGKAVAQYMLLRQLLDE